MNPLTHICVNDRIDSWLQFKFKNDQLTHTSQHRLNQKEWVEKLTPIDNIHRIEYLVWKDSSLLTGIRFYDKKDKVIFSTGNNIEIRSLRKESEFVL